MKKFKNYMLITFLLITGLVQANTVTNTNQTGYPCYSGGSYIPVNGTLLQSTGYSYTITPNIPALLGSYTNGIIGYNSSTNILTISPSSGSNFTNNTPFRIAIGNNYGQPTVFLQPGQSGNATHVTIVYTPGTSLPAINAPSYFTLNAQGTINVYQASTTLTNNYSQGGIHLDFYNSSNELLTYLSSYSSNTSIWIPTNASYATATANGLASTITVPVSASSSSTLFATGTMTNNTPTSVTVVYYNSSAQVMNSPAIAIAYNAAIPNLTGAAYISVNSYGSAFFIDQTSIDPNTSYFINSNGSITTSPAAAATLTNNYAQTAYSIQFYNNSGAQTGSTVASLSTGSSTPIQSGAVTASVNDLGVTLYTPVSESANSNLFTGATITNNNTENISVIYYGNLNETNNVALNNPAITITPGQNIPIITGALNISVYDNNGQLTTIIEDPLTSGQSYFIDNVDGTWFLSTFASSTELTNNYTQAASNVIFYNSSGIQTGPTQASLPAGGIALIPTDAVTAQLSDLGTVLQINASDSTDSNLFTRSTITNNSANSNTVTVSYSGTINGIPSNWITQDAISVAPGAALPIVTDTSIINVYLNDVLIITNAPISPNTSYFINDSSGSWSLSTSSIIYSLTNNYTTDATNLIFYNSSGEQTGVTQSSFSVDSTASIPTTAVTASVNDLGATVSTPVSGSTNSTVFTGATITNNDIENISVIYYGNLNGADNVALNSPAITITPGQNIPIITGALHISVYDNNGQPTTIVEFSLTLGQSYFIDSVDGAWFLSTFASSTQVTNNYTQAASNVIFYNSLSIQTGPTQASLPAGGIALIPTDAVTAQLSDLGTVLQINASDSTDSNLFTSGTITNNSANRDTVTVSYSGTINRILSSWITQDAISVAPGAALPIVTDTSIINVYLNDVLVITNTPITANTSYFINDSSGSWSLSTSSTIYSLTNNYTQSATNLIFYDTNSVQQGTTVASFPAGGTVSIPTTAVTVSVNDLGATVSTPVSGSTNSSLFTGATITNNYTENIGVIYYGNLNGATDVALNSPAITITPGLNIPIITGALNISVYDNNGQPTTIVESPLTLGQSYFIDNVDGAWFLSTFASSTQVTNNYTQDASNVIFYNSSGIQTGPTQTSFPAGGIALIPTDAVTAGLGDLGTVLQINVSGSTDSNIFTSGTITNNSANSDTVTVSYSGTIGGISSNWITQDPISLAPGAALPIVTDTSIVNVYLNDILIITNAPITPDTSYFINDSSGSWSLSTSSIIYSLTNNYTTDATNLIFYDSSNDQTGVTVSSFSAGGTASIPTTAITASVNDLGATVSTPVSGSTNSTVFTGATITHNNTENVSVIYYGNLNGTDNVALNSPAITITPGQYTPIITGALNISVYDNNGQPTTIVESPLTSGQSYFINNVDGIWFLSTFASSAQVTNNYTQAASNVVFYNNSSIQTGPTQASLPAGGIALIPTDAITAQLSDLGTVLQINASGSADSNLFTSGTITNNSANSDMVTVSYSGTINGIPSSWITQDAISVAPGAALPIVTDTSIINVYLNDVLVITNAPISPNTSYFINNSSGSWSLSTSSIIYSLTNNYTTNATNLIFYDTNSDQQGITVSLFPAGGTASIPTTAVTASVNDLGVTLSTPVSGTENTTIFGGSIGNNATETISINYYGLLNNVNTCMNSTQLAISPGGNIPIITGTTLINVYETSTGDLVLNASINNDNDYFIYNIDGNWTIETFSSTYTLTNNYNQPTSTITFDNSTGGQVDTDSSILPWQSISMPSTTALITATGLINNSSFLIPVPIISSTNIYTNFILTNNSGSSVNLIFYYSSGSYIQSGTLTLTNGQSVPIITGTAAITISGTSIIQQSITPLNSSYQITNNGSWILAPYQPTLTNDYTTNAVNLSFYTSNSALIPPVQSQFNSTTSVSIPGNATFATVTNLDSTLTFAASTAPTSNIFSINSTTNTVCTITNNAEETVYVTLYGTINDVSNATLNNPAIVITSGQSIPIITGASNISVQAGNTEVITQYQPANPIAANTSYFINMDVINGVEIWTLTTTIPKSPFLLINNYNETGNNLTFYSSIDTQIGTTQSTLDAYNASTIPVNTAYATIVELSSIENGLDATLVVPISDTASSNIFNNFVINNNSTENIGLIFYGLINATNTQLNNPAISVITSKSSPIITGSTNVAVIVNGVTEITQATGAINADTSYYVTNANGIWSLIPSLPTSSATLTNNYTANAINLIFYDIDGDEISGLDSFPAFSSAAIPTNTTSAVVTNQSSVITFSLSDTISSNLFNNYIITNNAGETVTIVYYSTLTTQLNNPGISVLNNQNNPIITGAQYYSVYDNTGTLQINQSPIAPNTSYTITAWESNPQPTTITLLNNYNTATNLMFYNSSNVQIGSTIPIFGAHSTESIPTSVVKAKFTESFNNVSSTLTIPVSGSVSSKAFTSNLSTNTLYVITNNSTMTIDVMLYGTINGIPNTQLTSVAMSVLPSASVPIITGTTTVSISNGIETVISQASISPNVTYYVNDSNDTWTINSYASITTLTNNYNQSATNLNFYDDTNIQIGTTQTSFLAFDSAPTPTTAVTASLTDLGSTITIPVSGSSLSTVFTNTLIANNSSETVYITFNGILNGSLTSLNSTPIAIVAGHSTPIIIGSSTVTVLDSSYSPTQISEIAIDQNSSYFITFSNGIWTLNQYSSSATLTNNYNSPATNLIFYNDTTTTSSSQDFNAYNTVAIPTNSTSAQFTDFSSNFTVPVSATTSSNVFVNYFIKNATTDQTIGIIFYGTSGQLNSPAISLTPGQTVPIPASTTYLTVTANNIIVINTSTLPQPLPLIVSYDITHNNNTWAIVPEVLTLTNNLNQNVTDINFYNSAGTLLDSAPFNSMQPWTAIPIPVQAVSAIAQYDSSAVIIPLSTTSPSKIFTNSTLINNSDQLVSILFSGTVNGVQNSSLNSTPLPLAAGGSIPFITGTLSVTIIALETIITLNFPVNSNISWEIPNNTNFRSPLTRAASSEPQVSSSALGVLRFIGGSTPVEPNNAAVSLYAENEHLFAEFLYVDLYAQTITDTAVRANSIATVNLILANYGQAYNTQPNFNYISYMYLIKDQLTTAKVALSQQYPSSSQQLTKFFAYLQKRVDLLLK